MNPEEEHTYDEMEAPETAKFHSHQLRPNYSVNNMNDQNNMGRNNNANMGGNVRNMNNNYQT
jgi:hypothetical protein